MRWWPGARYLEEDEELLTISTVRGAPEEAHIEKVLEAALKHAF
jgi:hypothetical protein